VLPRGGDYCSTLCQNCNMHSEVFTSLTCYGCCTKIILASCKDLDTCEKADLSNKNKNCTHTFTFPLKTPQKITLTKYKDLIHPHQMSTSECMEGSLDHCQMFLMNRTMKPNESMCQTHRN